jgi:hypothetical protein
MGIETRVCPYCGEPPGPGVFCASCGRNLSAVDRLPTRADWEAERGNEDVAPLAERGAAAVAAFLEAMHAAGDPARMKLPTSPRKAFGRQPTIEGWIVRPVVRDDEVSPRRYEPGLFLSADGAFHRLDSELRGWGQRDFPTYYESVGAEPIEALVDEQLVDELVALLRAHGVQSESAALRPDG